MKFPVLYASALTLLLSACGQPSTPSTLSSDLSPALPAQAEAPAAPEALAAPEVTDLSRPLPAAAAALNAQALDKSVPIILVHGLTGFGRDEVLGVKYWGGVFDVQEDLRALGYQVFTASVGPISSNWDRAAELYAQIKGGCVDYGAAHSAQIGHSRHDERKCYAGFYPEWDAEHPVNIIGHSMGGPTSMLLVKLLEDGSPANAEGDNLYAGGRAGWVRSVMTISGANTGSPAADNLLTFIPVLKESLVAAAIVAGDNPVYDFDLGQFGLVRRPGESFLSYADRIFADSSPLWKTDDQAGSALQVDKALRESQFIGRSAHTKYFSWATADTTRGLLTGWHYPNATMFTPFVATAYPYARPLPAGLGNVTGRSPEGLVAYDSSWWENDGLVPLKLQHQPLGQSSESYSGQATQPGRWYRLGTLNGFDHVDITGNFTVRDFRTFYRNQAAFLSSQN